MSEESVLTDRERPAEELFLAAQRPSESRRKKLEALKSGRRKTRRTREAAGLYLVTETRLRSQAQRYCVWRYRWVKRRVTAGRTCLEWKKRGSSN